MMPRAFAFATGIENSYPTVQWKGQTVRRDEMDECGHYRQWQEDFELVRELGLEYLRYGPPLYKSHKAPGKFDWGFADQTFNRLNASLGCACTHQSTKYMSPKPPPDRELEHLGRLLT
jgi:hypothetical protein